MTPHRLTEWAVISPDDPYQAPEQRVVLLSGLCPERAVAIGCRPDERIVTSPVVALDRDRMEVVTRTGTVYTLSGPPEAAYARWCAEHGYADALAALRLWEV